MRRKILWLVVPMVLTGVSMEAQTAPATPPASAPAQSVTTPQAPSQPPSQTTPGSTSGAQTQAQLPATGALRRLTVQDAEALAIKNNPRISVYHLLYLASNQVTREEKSGFYPSISANLTAVDANQGTRIAAGSLNSPRLLTRAAGGLVLSQLITDFGRTNNLVAMSTLQAKAADRNAAATVDEIKLAVDQAFYNALQNLALVKVAEQTVQERQIVSKQITTLFTNKLRSQLDVSFADANLAQAQLLLLDAQNNYQAALSMLSQVLGYTSQQQFELLETKTELTAPPDSASQLEDEAFSNRPEIAAQNYEYQAAEHYQKAERDLLLPKVEALGVWGKIPYGSDLNGAPAFTGNWYGGIGANINVPIFNGFLYPALSKEARLRAQAANEQLRDLKDRIANDVRTSWLNSITAYKRIGVSQQFVDQTNLALKLSQERYNLGLSSIVELSQAQLQQTQAQIQYAAARYQYRIAQAVLRFQVAAP